MIYCWFFYLICIVTCDNDCRIWLGITGPSLSQEQEKSSGNSEMATVLFKDRVDRLYCTKTSQCGNLQWKHCEFALNVVFSVLFFHIVNKTDTSTCMKLNQNY